MPGAPDLVLTFPGYRAAGERLAGALRCASAAAQVYRFPDGEARLRLPAHMPPRVVLCESLFEPDVKLIQLLLASRTARELGARHLTLVAPYLCYMRQDMAFTPGEAVSQRIIGAFLGEHFDGLITVDPHLHRIERLDQAVTGAEAHALTAAPLLAQFLQSHLHGPALLVGPDAESRQWVAAIAAHCQCGFIVAEKVRHGDRDVNVRVPPAPVTGRAVVLVDDMVSTGHTLATAAEQLAADGAGSIDALITHALFDDQAEQRLRDAGIRHIWSSDSIPHSSNAIQLAPLLADAIRAT